MKKILGLIVFCAVSMVAIPASASAAPASNYQIRWGHPTLETADNQAARGTALVNAQPPQIAAPPSGQAKSGYMFKKGNGGTN